MKSITINDFIFSPRYRVLRFAVYYLVHVLTWSVFWTVMFNTYSRNLFHMVTFIPAFLFFTLPIIYIFIPKLLLKKKYVWFLASILCWAIAGLFFHALYRQYVFIPAQELMGYQKIHQRIWEPSTFLCMCTSAGELSILVLFKHWVIKQQDWMQAQKDKISAELQLLKAQVHPHFLFNTLNNIYSFSLQQSPKTPGMVLKLSSLLSYMLYDCKAEEVLLEKELEIMKNYIELEKERYGEKIDVSINIEGEIQDRFISPLLLLPFLENAFKHGTSEQLEKPWLSFDLAVRRDILRCKIVNSKNDVVPVSSQGIGIDNIKKRLQFLYPGRHQLKFSDEGNFFVVSLELHLEKAVTERPAPVYTLHHEAQTENIYEAAVPFNR
ncbi:MAG: hypothetical protein EOO03_09535 [Chitinophagaceae bacterium]|nr:MAG: hypothetical protein EOO03_09535 [Chitinophagaceae bacterium]